MSLKRENIIMAWFLRNKKLIIGLLLFVLVFPLMADSKVVEIENPFGKNSTIWTILDKLINGIFWLSLPVGALMIVIAGFYFLTAGGDPEKVNTAKRIIFWTIVGIIIIFLSKALVTILLYALGVENPWKSIPAPGSGPNVDII